jgi:hypothetical protein
MIRHILVPSNGLEANLLDDAFKLASPFSAHVDVLHVGWEATREMHFYDNGLSPEMLDIPRLHEKSKKPLARGGRKILLGAMIGGGFLTAEER